jgi:hypothetical protein
VHLQISSVVGDFPLVHPAMYGKPTRYAYTSVTDVKDDSAQIKVRRPCGLSLPIHWVSDKQVSVFALALAGACIGLCFLKSGETCHSGHKAIVL